MSFLRVYLRFGVVGVGGFLVDAAVLYVMSGYIGLFYGRAVSFLSAVFVTWILNRRWTFCNHRSGMENKREFSLYLLLMLFGGAVNYGVYVWLVIAYPLVFQHPILGVAVGSLAGMIVNFSTSHFILFRHKVGI